MVSKILAALLWISEAQALPAQHTIVIETMKYSPQTLTVHANDSIIWVNKDLFPHTVTADHKTFNSKIIDAGKSWKYIARKKGHFFYHCDLHLQMKAEIRVQ